MTTRGYLFSGIVLLLICNIAVIVVASFLMSLEIKDWWEFQASLEKISQDINESSQTLSASASQLVDEINDLLVVCDRLTIAQPLIRRGKGKTTYYHDKFIGRKTSTGITFAQDSNIIACNFLPPKTIVVLMRGNLMTVGIVEDTGNLYGRDFDITKKMMSDLNGIHDGVVEVDYIAISPPQKGGKK